MLRLMVGFHSLLSLQNLSSVICRLPSACRSEAKIPPSGPRHPVTSTCPVEALA
jgi:hypothetical protein